MDIRLKLMVRSHTWSLLVAAAGVFVALGAGPYPVCVGPDHRHLIEQSGAPFVIQGDAPWSLISGLTREEAELYLESRHRQGFNSVIVNLIEHEFRGPANRYGEGPFTSPGDFSTPNEKVLRTRRLGNQKSRRERYPGVPCPDLFGVHWNRRRVDRGGALANGPEKCRGWGRYVGRRYRDFDSLVWMIGGDRNPDKAREDVNAVVLGIRRVR